MGYETSFKGKLIKKTGLTVNFLGDYFGEQVDREVKYKFPMILTPCYDDRFIPCSDEGGIDLISGRNIVRGTNSLYLAAVNGILRPKGMRTATPADLEEIIRNKALNFFETWVESALILRSDGNPDSYLAKDILKQLGFRLGNDLCMPLMIPLSDVELIEDVNSPYGLRFNLREDANATYTPQLWHENNGKRFSETDEKGLPIFAKKGKRTLSTEKSGLTVLCLSSVSGELNWDANNPVDGGMADNFRSELAYTGSLGRVVVVKPKS